MLRNSLLPSIVKLYLGENYNFQQDVIGHTSKTTKNWLGNHNVSVFCWPSTRPDLNVIGTTWHKTKVILKNKLQQTFPKFKAKIEHIWNVLSPEMCRSLVDLMRHRIRAIIKSKSDITLFKI